MKTGKNPTASIVGIALLVIATGCSSQRDPSLSVLPGGGSTSPAGVHAPDQPDDNRAHQTPRPTVAKETGGIALPPDGPTLAESPPVTNGVPQPAAAPVSTAPQEQSLPDRIRFGDYWLDADSLKSDTVYFAFDRSDIRTDELVKIEEVAVFLKTRTENAILIDGHCDDRGTEEYNRALGERRALTIRETLVSMGVTPDRIHTRSLGEDRPAEIGQNEFAWSRNRRGEFALLVPVTPDS